MDNEKDDDLRDLCKGMAVTAPEALMATDRTVELDQSPENVLVMLETATKDYPIDEQERVVSKDRDDRNKKTK